MSDTSKSVPTSEDLDWAFIAQQTPTDILHAMSRNDTYFGKQMAKFANVYGNWVLTEEQKQLFHTAIEAVLAERREGETPAVTSYW